MFEFLQFSTKKKKKVRSLFHPLFEIIFKNNKLTTIAKVKALN